MFLAAQEVLKIIADNLKKAGWSLGLSISTLIAVPN
jgi:hypothetical protein